MTRFNQFGVYLLFIVLTDDNTNNTFQIVALYLYVFKYINVDNRNKPVFSRERRRDLFRIFASKSSHLHH